MNKTLDSFESALLLELRQQVAEHPARLPARPRRRLRLAAVGALAVQYGRAEDTFGWMHKIV